MPRVLVTGANGFAGTAICRHLLAVFRGVNVEATRHPGLLRLTGRSAVIAAALGWSPAYTLDEGLALTVQEAA